MLNFYPYNRCRSKTLYQNFFGAASDEQCKEKCENSGLADLACTQRNSLHSLKRDYSQRVTVNQVLFGPIIARISLFL